MRLTVAAAQFACPPFDLDGNFRRAEQQVRDAARQGVDLLVLPEFFAIGYTYHRQLVTHGEPLGGRTTQWMQDLSKETGVSLIACFLEQGLVRRHDTLVLTTPEGHCHAYRKRYPAFFERLFFSPGRQEGIFHTPLGRIGTMVCWDMVQKKLARELAGRVDLLVISAAWPNTRLGNLPLGPLGSWIQRQPGHRPQQLAKQLGVPVIFSNMVGPFHTPVPGSLLTYRTEFEGRSSVYDHKGRAMAGFDHEQEGLVIGQIDHPRWSLKAGSRSKSGQVASARGLQHNKRRAA